MQKERQKGLTFSGILHVVLFLLVLVGLPSLFFRKVEPEPMAITVDIVPVGPITNIKPSEQLPTVKPQPEEKKAEAKKATTASKTEPPPPKPEEKKPDEKKQDDKKPEPKPEEKKPEPKKEEKKKEDDFDKLMKDLEQKVKKEQADKPNKKQENASSSTAKSNVPYDPNVKISQTVQDSIRSQLYKCWSIPAGAKDADKLVIVVELTLNRDGSLIDAKFTSATRARMGDPFYRTAAESAMRAVRMCSPLQGLPADKYEGWSFMEFTFNPKDL